MANAKIIEKKKDTVSEIKNKISDANSIVLFDYRGLSVAEVTELRCKLREADSEYKVYKNTLTKRAMDDLNIDIDEYLEGPSAISFSADQLAPIKVLSEFAKKHDKLELKVGIVDGKVTNVEELSRLATIPSREGLLTMLAGGMIATVKDLAIALDLYSKEKEENK